MRITPVVAALTGTSLGALASLIAAGITQRATTLRDRERRLWDRRADAYSDVMATIHTFARLRAYASRTGRLPKSRGRQDEATDSAAALAARIEIYGSEALRGACVRSFDAMQAWMSAWERWHKQGEGHRLPNDEDALWLKFTMCVEESRKADSQLLGLLRDDVHGKPRKRKFRRSREST
ncbi:hypothetical protein ACIP79_27785 [Streptomyces sp. NPDC088747]|uniref:hypothetical protein n=1 Tax=Streptomyces sp. NPDC088747 TaxID=3365886 RepID=UPI0038111453